MSPFWNDDERDTSGMVSSRASVSEAKEHYVSICDVVKEFYNDQKEKQYARVAPGHLQERRKPLFAKPPPPPVSQTIDVFVNEEEENDVEEANETILENEMYKKSWYS